MFVEFPRSNPDRAIVSFERIATVRGMNIASPSQAEGGIVLSKPALVEPPGATVPVKEDAGFTAMGRHPEEK